MKIKSFHIILLTFFISFFSCDEKEDVEPDTTTPNTFGPSAFDSTLFDREIAEDFYGEWYLVEWKDSIARDLNGDGVKSNDLLTEWDSCITKQVILLSEAHRVEIMYAGPQGTRCCFNKPSGESYFSPFWDIKKDEHGYFLMYHDSDVIWKQYFIKLDSNEIIAEGMAFLHCPKTRTYTDYSVFHKRQ